MFTDVHHHIIYGVDDGPQTLEQAQAMLRKAAEQGVRHIVCTSHAVPARRRFPLETYYAHLEEEQAFCREAGLQVTLHPGSEIMWMDGAARLLREGAFPSLNQSRYALIEFYPQSPWTELQHAALSLAQAGYTPVFAHVERFDCLRKNGRLQELRDNYGSVLQMNAGTVLETLKKGLFIDRWPKKVLEMGLIDVIATDAHNVGGRVCRMQECYGALAQRFGQDYADQLCIEVPELLRRNEQI